MANDNFQPPPTYALPILLDEKTGLATFNPIWLKWFLDLAGWLNAAGGTTIGINHNQLNGLQGGQAPNEYYHLNASDYANIIAGVIGVVITYVSEAEIINVAGVDTDAFSHTVTANRLANAGETLEINVAGTFSDSTSADKRIKLVFGGTTVFDSGTLTI